MSFFDIIVALTVFLGFVAPCYLAWVLMRYRGMSLGAPRDIRVPKPILERLVEVGVDWFSPVGNPTTSLETIYSAGRKGPQYSGKTSIFKAKLGWRIGVLPMITFLMWVTFKTTISDSDYAVMDWFVVLAVTALSIWVVFYVFAFRVEVLENEIRCMGPFFDVKTYDLARLTKAEDFGDSYALRFDCGGRVSIPNYVEGHDTLKKLILHALKVNGR